MPPLKSIIEDTDTRAGRTFDLVIQALIILSLITFAVDTLRDLPPAARTALRVFEIASVAVFTLEYAARLWVADRKWRFVFSLQGIVDLLAIAPFYLRLGIDLRAVRVLRLFRLFRIFKLLRYSKAIRRYARAFASIREELALYFMASGMLMFVASTGIYYFESDAQPEHFGNLFKCLWWSLVTLTTVGYGDSFPITTGGKLFTTFIVLLGIGVVAVPSGLIASALTRARDEASAAALPAVGQTPSEESGTP